MVTTIKKFKIAYTAFAFPIACKLEINMTQSDCLTVKQFYFSYSFELINRKCLLNNPIKYWFKTKSLNGGRNFCTEVATRRFKKFITNAV